MIDDHSHVHGDLGLDRQPVPTDSRCPDCGAEPTDESLVEHRLSDLGYTHDDQTLSCSDPECGRTWTCGVPIGIYHGSLADDLHCDSCEDAWFRVHRIRVPDPSVASTDSDAPVAYVYVKCPNCYRFRRLEREFGPHGFAMLGFPHITGATDGARAFGYPDSDDTSEE